MRVRFGRLLLLSLALSVGIGGALRAAEEPATPPAATPVETASPSPAYTTEQALDYAARWGDLGDFGRAIGWYRYILPREPENKAAMFGIADAFRQMGNNTEAKGWYQQYIRGPGRDDPKGYYGLARVVQASEYHTLAITNFRHALRLDLNYVEAMKGLAESLRAKGKHEEARRYAEDAVQRVPRDHEARRVLAVTVGEMGELEAAVVQMNAAVQIVRDAFKADPSDASQLAVLSTYYGYLEAMLQRQVAGEQENVAALNALSAAMQDRAHVEHALRLYGALQVSMQAAEIAPRDVETLLILAGLQEQLQLLDVAAATYRAVLAVEPNHPFAKQRVEALPAPTTQPTATAPTTRGSP